MKTKSSQSAFFNIRVIIGLFFGLAGVFLALLSFSVFSKATAQTGGQTQPSSGAPEIVQLVGPVRLDQDLRSLPYVAPKSEFEERVLTRYPHPGAGQTAPGPSQKCPNLTATLLKNVWRPAPTIPSPLLTFEGVAQPQSGCGCEPPDTNGDVGPNHYVEAVNSSFKVFDKNGITLAGPTTYNSLFAPLVGTPCSGQNDGDPFVLYDPLADRWLVSDFAFPSFPGSSFWQCIAVSQTSSPVTGGWFLYALQVDPGNPTFLGDYPKFGFWNNPQPGGAYFLTVNLFNPSFQGVRAFALDRASMLAGGPTNAVAFTIGIAGLGDSYSLVPATFRTGTPPPAGRDEFLLAIDSPATGGVTLTQVKGWLFHVNFAGGSTLGIGTNHTPNALITVTGFIDAFTSAAGFAVVPQSGTTHKLDSLGDKIMTPVAYQNRSGTESLWAANTVCTDANCTVSTGIRWYQFNVTGGTFPATPVQQQTWTNTSDGLWRFMPSIAVDSCGDTAIGYATSSASIFPGIRYAGRLATDPLNNLSQGEAILFSGTGSQTGLSRWGDYSMTTVDPADGATFWHANEYYAINGDFNWHTRIGKFKFTECGGGGGANLVSAASRLTHGTAGTFDIAMPLTGTSGVEDRDSSTYTAVFTFDTAVTSGSATVTGGTATAGTPTFSGNEMRVPLTGVANVQNVTIHTSGVNGGTGTADVVFGFLIADADANRLVDQPDSVAIRGQVRQPVTAANFRDDVIPDGVIARADAIEAKTHRGESIP